MPATCRNRAATNITADSPSGKFPTTRVRRRTSRSSRSSTVTDLYYSAAWQALEERVSGTTKIQYVWSPVYVDALVLRDRDADGNAANGLEERLYVQQDANWNVTALVDASGNLVERYVYDPYGNVTVLTPSWGSRASTLYAWVYLHQGGRYENVSALYHFRYRDYSPTLGRWVQRDPIQYVAGDANLYRHEANRPINMLDPTGLESITYRLFHAPLVGRSQWAFSVTLTADFDPKTGRVIGNPTLSDPVGLTTMTQKGLAAKLNLHKVGDVKTGWSQEAEFALITSDPKVEVVKGTVPGLGGVKLPCELVVATLDFTLIKKGTFDVSVLSVEGGVVSLGYKEQQKGTVLKGRIHLGLGPAYWHYGYADYGFDARGITAWEQAPRDATARRLPETKVAKTPFTEAYEVIWRK